MSDKKEAAKKPEAPITDAKDTAEDQKKVETGGDQKESSATGGDANDDGVNLAYAKLCAFVGTQIAADKKARGNMQPTKHQAEFEKAVADFIKTAP